MAKLENDTIYFLILWLIAMFLTISIGIIVIMYQVRCFPCQYNEVDSYHKKDHHKHNGTHHHSDFHSHPIHFDGKHLRTCMVCGEVMSTEEEGEIHQSCHDVDVMCV